MSAETAVMTDLTDEEQAWYSSLTEKEVEELRNGYVDKVIVHHNMGTVSYAGFIKVCFKVAMKLKEKGDKKESRTLRKLERLGRQ